MNEDMPLAELLSRAHAASSGGAARLSPQELRSVITRIQHPNQTSTTDLVALIRILGYEGGPHYRSVLEPFLGGPDASLAHWALWVLCEYWGLTAEYVDVLARYIRGVDWDDLGTCRYFAMVTSSDYLQSHKEPKLLRAFVALLAEPSTLQEDREEALHALARAYGNPGINETALLQLAKSHIEQEEEKRQEH